MVACKGFKFNVFMFRTAAFINIHAFKHFSSLVAYFGKKLPCEFPFLRKNVSETFQKREERVAKDIFPPSDRLLMFENLEIKEEKYILK